MLLSAEWLPLGGAAFRESSAVSAIKGADVARSLDHAVASAFVTARPARKAVGSTAMRIENRLPFSLASVTLKAGMSAGAAISIHEVTGKPLKFEGIGEKLDDLQLFNANSMADRIIGMGDTINFVKKAKEHISEEEAGQLEEKMRKASFTYEDYLKQMQAVRKMGSLKGLMKMIPGASKFADLDRSEKEFYKIEAMILSMTQRERAEKDDLSMSRMKRVARGSGTTVQDINKLKKSFKQSKQFFKGAPSKKIMDKFMDMDKGPF